MQKMQKMHCKPLKEVLPPATLVDELMVEDFDLTTVPLLLELVLASVNAELGADLFGNA